MHKKFFWLAAAILAAVLVVYFFVPAFRGDFFIPPAIEFADFSIRWYGLVLSAAVLTGLAVARHYSWKFGIGRRQVENYAFWLIIVSFIGARFYFVLFEYRHFFANPSEIYRVWSGGLSIYGSLIAGFVFTTIYCRGKAFSVWQMLDLAALSLPLAQAVGRFGNFFNQEAFGAPTDLPWKMYIFPSNRPEQYRSFEYFHPAFLYEAIWSVIIFFILKKLIGRKSGTIALVYLCLYACGRLLIELIRTDSIYVHGLKADALVSAAVLLFAGGLLIARRITKNPVAA